MRMKFSQDNLNKIINKQRKNNLGNFVSLGFKFWAKRILRLILEIVLIVWVVYTLVFLLMNLPYIFGIDELMPSGVAAKLAHASESEQQAIIDVQFQLLHLDRGLFYQYWHSIVDLFNGSMGTSWTTLQPVSNSFWSRLGISASIGFMAVILSILIGIPLGIFLARRQGFISDAVASLVSVVAFSIPSFVIALLLVLFNSTIGLPFVFEYGNIYMFLLAALAIAIPVGFGYTRYLRTSVRQEFSEQYVALARVKGVPENRILSKHVLKPSMFPIINYLPFVVVGAFFGSITIETVFAIPGTGQMLITAALSGDQPTVLAITTLYTLFTVISFFIRDILIAFVDPRIKGE